MPSVQVPDGSDHLIQSSRPGPPQTTNSLRSKILRNTCISRHHLTPEIALRLITAECDIYHRPMAANSEAGGHGFDADPFWGFYWPGGQALTRYVAVDSLSPFALYILIRQTHPRSQILEVCQQTNSLSLRFILDNGHLFEGRRVLDVGCGCGASSIAASQVAASHVIANDIDHGKYLHNITVVSSWC